MGSHNFNRSWVALPALMGSSILHVAVFIFTISNMVGASSSSLKQSDHLPLLNRSLSPLFVFGDSTVDPGNNNFILTIAKCNFPPYGRDFPNHVPTGRFSNGRLVTDFIASYIGVKENIPPYLDQSLSLEELTTGVSFASGGSGYDPLTSPSIGGVITIERQLQYFREFKARLEEGMGKERMQRVVSNAVFLVSSGTNDLNAYFGTPSLRRQQYTLPAYRHFLLHLVQNFLQGLLEEGAQRIGVVGLPPIGCLPTVITWDSQSPIYERKCLDAYSAAAREYNQMLQDRLRTMQPRFRKLAYIEIYKPLEDMVQNPTKFGFDEVNKGCCGSGLFEYSVLCNPKSIVCSDASKYLFWDAVHPTQAAYYYIFNTARPTIDYFFKT
ncbi:unnamed protein product [Cuscuta campestris]|uniref:SGNH hydrolase-type esterase domain-containing protein n=1 Tax=Cuscuta campestris TaxID=132261 RepID=A0A484MLZ2_9ASTE|nr:unnamed protein product [Cuscuta campestris]